MHSGASALFLFAQRFRTFLEIVPVTPRNLGPDHSDVCASAKIASVTVYRIQRLFLKDCRSCIVLADCPTFLSVLLLVSVTLHSLGLL